MEALYQCAKIAQSLQKQHKTTNHVEPVVSLFKSLRVFNLPAATKITPSSLTH